MVIESKLKNLIRKNSVASIGTDGLMGNKLVNIDPGTPDAAIITEGDILPSLKAVNTEEMLRTLELTNSNIAIISANLKTVTENLNKSRGTLYTVLMDTTIASGLTHTIKNIENVSEEMSSVTRDFSTMMSGVKSGKGTLGILLNDTSTSNKISHTIDNLKESGQQISELSTRINNISDTLQHGKGTFATFLNDTVMANSLKKSIINLNISAEKLNETLDALKHSTLLRGSFRKAEEAKQKESGK
jgi:phospholipid/cholesterol/gamma-HCH transport system substrate-binding protein